ncbi:MAG: flagellar export protein FliJ [Lachnospiraceae bacterium]|nr:flagellar export protein FliJ [Lachnospiraceae bacterium]
MKKFQYRLETVLAYKTQVLDNLKTEHATIMQNVNRKQEEILGLHQELNGYESQFDQAKEQGTSIENYRLFDMCIGRMEEIIDTEKEHLKVLRKQEDAKKQEVISAKVDTSRYEKLKEKKTVEYQRAVAKADELFVEEFVSGTALRQRQQYQRQHRG